MTILAQIIPENEIARFCRSWKIAELSLFGSALRGDLGPNSDLDFLVMFAEDAEWGLLDHVKIQQELQALLQRNVDIISKSALKRSQNWLRRKEILDTAQVIYSEKEAVHAAR